MAKKTTLVKESGSRGSLFDLVGSIDNSSEILAGSHHVIKEYVSTGNYIVNAAMTGSLFKGVPSGRVITLAGEESTGKSFLAVSICKNAQKMGYTPVYLDSENAIDVDFVERLGCDPENFIIRPTQTISDMSTFVANLTDKELALPEDQRHKIILVIDSVGNLTSDKEKTDIIEGNQKRDMTKQQELKAFFRTAAVPLGQLQIPCIVVSHVYQTMDLYAQKKVSGGCLVPDSLIQTPNGLVPIKDIKVGDSVINCFGEDGTVIKTFRFKKPTIKFDFSDGTSIECSYDHKFMVENGDDVEWKKASELNENDSILCLCEE